MINLDTVLFFILGGVCLLGALGVLLLSNPIYAALSLAVTMTGLAAMFFSLGAYFVAGVQLIVYAGAVMVLFVMVVMLFDLKKDLETYSRGLLSAGLKMACAGAILGFLVGGIEFLVPSMEAGKPLSDTLQPVRDLAMRLFNHHVFEFEVVSVLLLVVIVGAVSVARSKGGTHA